MTSASPPPEPLHFLYRFNFPGEETKQFEIQLDPDTLVLISNKQPPYPDWTKLSFNKCTNCPLNEEQYPHCPVAVNLSDVVEFFRKIVSHQISEVEIVTEARTYKKQASIQQALSSLMGMIMVTSNCPILDKLRPLVRTHLPFATLEETTYRVISMYLLAQFFLKQEGEQPDWELKELPKIYEQIQIVNRCFNTRIAEVQIADSSSNAVVILNCQADYTTALLSQPELNQVKKLFSAYLEKSDGQ